MNKIKRVAIKRFNDFNNNVNTCEKFYNFYPTTVLNNSLGIDEAKFPYSKTTLTESSLGIEDAGITRVDGLAYFGQYSSNAGDILHRLLIYAGDKKLYMNQMLDEDYEVAAIYNLEFDNPPITLAFKKNDVDSIILTDGSVMKIWQTGYSPYTVSNTPIITSMCMSDGVLYCTIKEPAFKIWYATDLSVESVGDITNHSGYLVLDDELGHARKIVSFDQDVYVFRDYGISKIKRVAGEIVVSQVYLSNSRIYADTVSVCGNVIMFMTKDGIYSFNGVKVSKTPIAITHLMSAKNNAITASSLQNKYYIALRLDFGDNNTILCEENQNYVNNALIVIDILDYTYQIIRGVDIKSFLPVKTDIFEKMLLTFNTGHTETIGQIVNSSICFSANLPKYWSCGDLLNNYNTKLFTKLTVDADANVSFAIKYDNKTKVLTTSNSGLNVFNFKFSCKQIKLDIYSSAQSAKVKNVYLDYYEY